MVGVGAGIVTIHGTILGITLVIHGVGVTALGIITTGAGEAGTVAAAGMAAVVGTVAAGMADITTIITQALYIIVVQDVPEALIMDREDTILMDATLLMEDIHPEHRTELARLMEIQVVREPVRLMEVQPMVLVLLVLHMVMQILVRQRVLVTTQGRRPALVRAMELPLAQQHVRAIIQDHRQIVRLVPVQATVLLLVLPLVQVIAAVRQVIIVRVQDQATAVRLAAQAHHVRAIPVHRAVVVQDQATAVHLAVVVQAQGQATVAHQAAVVQVRAHHVRVIAVRRAAVVRQAALPVLEDHLVVVAVVAAAEVAEAEADNEQIS